MALWPVAAFPKWLLSGDQRLRRRASDLRAFGLPSTSAVFFATVQRLIWRTRLTASATHTAGCIQMAASADPSRESRAGASSCLAVNVAWRSKGRIVMSAGGEWQKRRQYPSQLPQEMQSQTCGAVRRLGHPFDSAVDAGSFKDLP